MATIEQGILGAFRGKCGSVIGYLRNGVPCIRSMPTHYRDRRSQRQLENRSRFSMVMKTMSLVRPVISLGFRRFATDMTAMNVATLANYYTLVKNHPDGLRYHFSSLLLSRGPVEPLSDLMMCVYHSSVDLIWNGLSLPGGSRDQVSVVLLNTDKMALRFFQAVATRQQGNLTLSLPSGWHGDPVYCYTLVERAGDWSDSACAGELHWHQPELHIQQPEPTSLHDSQHIDTQSLSSPAKPLFSSHQSALKHLSVSGPPRPDI